MLKELEPIIKSEEEGEQSNETVKKIVGSTIVSTVEQSHLFLMVYSPSCPHCDKLKPVWANLGSEFANIDVTIGKLDNTLNDIPVSLELEVTGVPTLAFFKRGSIKAVVHEGPRSISGLRTFLKKQLADVADETQEL